MTYLAGGDSAFGPSPATARLARSRGWTYWDGYGAGPGSYHVWTAAEWAILRTAGLAPGYIWVPTMGMSENPVQAAAEAVGDATGKGLYGAIQLDTEHLMTANADLVDWIDSFCDEVAALGRPAAVYAGANYVPLTAAAFWPLWGTSVYPGAAEKIQYGPNSAGILNLAADSVDVSLCGLSYPLGSWSKPTPPKPKPVPPPAPGPVYPEDNMQSIAVNVAFANGSGWCPSPVDIHKVVSVVPEGSDVPAVGSYPAIPAFESVAGDPTHPNGILTFGPGPHGPAANGVYGFFVWAVTS